MTEESSESSENRFLFEHAWREGYNCFERVFDTKERKSIKRKINLPYEWYEPNPNGKYSYILDENVKLEKKQGRAKDGRDKYGFLDPIYRQIRDMWWSKNLYNSGKDDVRKWYLDIETRSGTNSKGFPKPEHALEPISLMQIYDSFLDCMIVLGVREWKHQDDYDLPCKVKYIHCTDEVDLILKYNAIFKKLNPLIIYAWFGMGFDFPYIHNRMKNLGIDPKAMSNFGDVKLESYFDNKGNLKFRYNSDGHFYIDIMDVYIKFTFHPMDDYKLDTVAEYELKKNKVQHTEYSKFDDFYTGKYVIPDNPTEEQKNSKIYQEAIKGNVDEVKELSHSNFVYYGVMDTFLLKEIDDKKNFTALMMNICKKMGVTMLDALGTVRPWSQYLSNYALKNMQVMPPKQDHEKPDIVGGYVRDPFLGKLRWVMSEDVNSMYPLLSMVAFNMSPETFIPIAQLPGDLRDIILSHYNNQDETERLNLPDHVKETVSYLLKKYNYSMGINGAVFDRSKEGMIPKLVNEIYASRSLAKKNMFKYEKQKLLIDEIIKRKETEQQEQQKRQSN